MLEVVVTQSILSAVTGTLKSGLSGEMCSLTVICCHVIDSHDSDQACQVRCVPSHLTYCYVTDMHEHVTTQDRYTKIR